MKILITVHQFFPDYTAGTEVLTLSVARELLSRGHNVRIYTGYPTNKRLLDHERFDEYQFEGIHVYRFHHAYEPMGGQTSLIEVGYDNFVAANYFERIVNDFKPDVVHFFHLNRLGTRLIDKANLLGVPTFMTFTDFWPICPTGQLLLPSGKLCIGPNQYASNCVRHLAQSTQKGVSGKIAGWVPLVFVNMLTKIATLDCCSESKGLGEIKAISMRLETNLARLNCLKKIIAPNKMMRKLLIELGIDAKLIIESFYGVDIAQSNSTEPVRAQRSPFRIGYIGTLAHHKGCHVLIEAFKALPYGSAILNIYGKTEEFPDYAAALNLSAVDSDKIKFCGTFPISNISQIIADFDVLVVPSVWHENTPLVVYSAQMSKCPVVASNVGGMSEVIIDNYNGLLFESGNAASLTLQLLRLINDSDLLSTLSQNAKVPKSTSDYTDELLSIWQDIE